MDPRLFSPDTLAERWGCSATQVRTLIKSGKLSAFRIGSLYRIRLEAVEAFESQASPEPSAKKADEPSNIPSDSASLPKRLIRLPSGRLKEF